MAPKRKAAGRKGAARPSKQEDVAVAPAPPSPPPSAERSDEDQDRQPVVEQEEADVDEPIPKKAKKKSDADTEVVKKKRGRKPKASAASKKAPAKKKEEETHELDDVEKEDDEEDGGTDEQVNGESVKVVVVEASKECNCFKTRAAKVQATLTKSVPGVEVQVNPEKPRKGCFEIRDEKGNVYLSLLGLPRPFTKLKNWDLDKTLEEIVAKIK